MTAVPPNSKHNVRRIGKRPEPAIADAIKRWDAASTNQTFVPIAF
jgi:hypothetical protein